MKDELEHAQYYLIISKMRYKDCFQFHFNIQEEVMECKTIKLILQPLLENAIMHGIDKNLKCGLIEINGWLDKDSAFLTVTDNGKGIRQERLEELKKILFENLETQKCDNGIGLVNVNQRIKLNFGSEYGVDIDSVVEQWTRVTIKIPLLRPSSDAN